MTEAPPPVRLLEDGRGGTIRLALADPALLFAAPATRPLDGQHDDRPGIALILEAMKLAWPPKDGRLQRLVLEVPEPSAGTATEARLRAAIAAYCDQQVALAAAGVRLMAKERRRTWKLGGLFLALMLGLSLLVARWNWLPETLQMLLQGSLVIAGCVGLWRPIALTLYDWWPERLRLGLNNHLKAMPVAVTYG